MPLQPPLAAAGGAGRHWGCNLKVLEWHSWKRAFSQAKSRIEGSAQAASSSVGLQSPGVRAFVPALCCFAVGTWTGWSEPRQDSRQLAACARASVA